jgi:hypothetical protein
MLAAFSGVADFFARRGTVPARVVRTRVAFGRVAFTLEAVDVAADPALGTGSLPSAGRRDTTSIAAGGSGAIGDGAVTAAAGCAAAAESA